MQYPLKRAAAVAGSCAALYTCCLTPAAARHHYVVRPRSGETHRASREEPAESVSPHLPAYDEIRFAAERGVLPGGPESFSAPLTTGAFLNALHRLRADYIHHGIAAVNAVPTAASLSAHLTREQAVDLLVKTLVPTAQAPTWDADTLAGAITDSDKVTAPYLKSVTLAAEKLFLPNPLRPTEPADRAFGAEILARALPLYPYAPPGPFSDEIQKALSMHLFYSNGRFTDGPVTTGELARAIARARMYLPADLIADLPPLPVASTDPYPLTREQAIAMVVEGLVADAHFNTRLATAGASVVDSDARVAYALGPQTYLSSFKDAESIPRSFQGAIAVATYKGWIPNISTEPGEVDPKAPASLGYVCTLLSRAVVRPGDYTGIIIDMSRLQPLERAGGMWILNAGDSPDKEQPAVLIYPSSAHLPVRPFFSAPGALAYYGTVDSAEAGRAGRHPLIIQALDWARYDWSITHGDPGLRRGGGTAVPLDHFHFVRGTPPLILLSPEDAHKLQALDHKSLLLRTARLALVQSNWSLTAMR